MCKTSNLSGGYHFGAVSLFVLLHLALIAVLASSSDELADSSEDTCGDLAKALLRLLISTKADAQQQLAFGEK